LLAAGLVTGLAGCGYTMRPLHRTDVRTVAAPIFASKEFRRELEFDLSRELVKFIELRTPYKVVHDAKRADTEIRGEIMHLSAPVLSEDTDTDRPQDIQVTVTCWFEWKDLRTGEILAKRSSISGSGTWAPAIGESQDSATNEAMRRLAERIVEAMESDW
jgi:hypothetical protein